MDLLIKNLAGLLKVKTIITLLIIVVFCYKTLTGIEITSEFVMIASAVVTYYFAKDKLSTDTERL
ncbi:MAG: hypothetical protein FWB76_00845 [Oscillospiraceae bacterium]|nr:hypothetical protein [Oscillospiraceae bacterium]